MELGATLYIKNTIEAVEFYKKAFGMTLGYYDKFPDGTYIHAELQKDGKTIFAISEYKNDELISTMHELARKRLWPTMSYGINFETEAEVQKAYEILSNEGTILREIGSLPWSACSADVLDKYGVYWYITV